MNKTALSFCKCFVLQGIFTSSYLINYYLYYVVSCVFLLTRGPFFLKICGRGIIVDIDMFVNCNWDATWWQ